MAIVDQPLWSDTAKGTIRHTITFFLRGEWYHVGSLLSHKKSATPAQLAQRQLFLDAVLAWRNLSPEERQDWNDQALWPLTGFNTFLEATMSPVECPTQWYEETPRAYPSEPRMVFTFTNPGPDPTFQPVEVIPTWLWSQEHYNPVSYEKASCGPSITFSYSIT